MAKNLLKNETDEIDINTIREKCDMQIDIERQNILTLTIYHINTKAMFSSKNFRGKNIPLESFYYYSFPKIMYKSIVLH